MLKPFMILLLSFPAIFSAAQETDSLFAVKKDGAWEIRYTAKAGENSRMLAKRFFLNESQLEYSNGEETMRKMTEGSFVYIPVVKENFLVVKPPPLSMKNIHELYYRAGGRDDISLISTYSGVTKVEMRAWNDLRGNSLRPGQALFIGWVKVMDKDSSNPLTFLAYPSPKKKVVEDTTADGPYFGGLDSLYEIQTNSGLNVLTEKGTAVFFEKTGKSSMYYAFHNEAARGSIIKVHNPGSGKTILVKVLGPLPDTKLYANCIIGISDAAKEDLGINDSKAWCELSYAAN